MKRILRIDCSARLTGSNSRDLGDYFIQTWLDKYPTDEITVRDLITDPIPHITEAMIEGYYANPQNMDFRLKNATHLSEKLVAELKRADILLINTPMYNFSIPSALKAYIDQIVRINYTFSYDGGCFSGLVKGKKAFVISTYGTTGYTLSGSMIAYNYLQPYLTTLLNFLGITDVTHFTLEGTSAHSEEVWTNKRSVMDSIVQEIMDSDLQASFQTA